MKRYSQIIVGLLGIAAMAVMTACDRTDSDGESKVASAHPPEPVVTYTEADAEPGQRIEHGELIVDVDEAKRLLHAQHHPTG